MAAALRIGLEEAASSHSHQVRTDHAHYNQATAEVQPAVVTQAAPLPPMGMVSYKTTSC